MTCRFWWLSQYISSPIFGRKGWRTAVCCPLVTLPGCLEQSQSVVQGRAAELSLALGMCISPPWPQCWIPELWSKDAPAALGVLPAPHGRFWCLQGGLVESLMKDWKSRRLIPKCLTKLRWNGCESKEFFFTSSICTSSVCCVIAATFHKPV